MLYLQSERDNMIYKDQDQDTLEKCRILACILLQNIVRPLNLIGMLKWRFSKKDECLYIIAYCL